MPTTIPVIVVTLLPDFVSPEVRGKKIKASTLISCPIILILTNIQYQSLKYIFERLNTVEPLLTGHPHGNGFFFT